MIIALHLYSHGLAMWTANEIERHRSGDPALSSTVLTAEIFLSDPVKEESHLVFLKHYAAVRFHR